jgi:hypothetical protein
MRTILIALLCLTSASAFAQQATTTSPTPADPTHPTATSMEEPRAGDHWTYEIRDEISGSVMATRTDTITEVTPSQIGVRYANLEKGTSSFHVFDHGWNAKTEGDLKYVPHNGLGIVPPLKTGAVWDFKAEETNTAKGFTWKWSGRSKVSGQESVTTKAGTFDTFKIETTYTASPVNNPGRKSEITVQTWYAPAVDHWVRRTIVIRTDNLLRLNQKVELVAYGRKQ